MVQTPGFLGTGPVGVVQAMGFLGSDSPRLVQTPGFLGTGLIDVVQTPGFLGGMALNPDTNAATKRPPRCQGPSRSEHEKAPRPSVEKFHEVHFSKEGRGAVKRVLDLEP